MKTLFNRPNKQKPPYLRIMVDVLGIFLLTLFLVSTMSCSSHYGAINSTYFTEPVRFEESVYGDSKEIRILGITITKNKDLLQCAKLNLYQKHPLKESQNYSNVVVDIRKRSYIFFEIVAARVSAEIVTSVGQNYSRHYSSKFNSLFNINVITESELSKYFRSNDEVFYPYPEKWKVFFVLNDSMIKIRRDYSLDSTKIREVHHSNLMKGKSKVDGLLAGQFFEYIDNNSRILDTLKIIGFNYQSVFLQSPKTGLCCDTISYDYFNNKLPIETK